MHLGTIRRTSMIQPPTLHLQWFLYFLLLLTSMICTITGTSWSQVADADCFSGLCGGQPGIPECPDGFEEVGFLAYANNRANLTEDCVTVVTCTNFSRKQTVLDCRFFYGFNSLPPNGDPQGALCHALDTKPLFRGDTSECATDADDQFKAGGIFGAADGNCPVFEGKGLVCSRGGDADRILCHAHLSCGNGTTLEPVPFIPREEFRKIRDDHHRGHGRSRDGKDD